MKIKIDKINCLKEDLKIPKGYRLLEMWEVLKEAKTDKKINDLLTDEFIWCILNNNKIGAVRFGDDDGRFLVDGDYYFDLNGGRSRGVFVKIGDLI